MLADLLCIKLYQGAICEDSFGVGCILDWSQGKSTGNLRKICGFLEEFDYSENHKFYDVVGKLLVAPWLPIVCWEYGYPTSSESLPNHWNASPYVFSMVFHI